MALKIKVKTLRVPNLDKLSDAEVSEIEEENEDAIKAKINDGYAIECAVGGDNFSMIVFKKE